MQPNQQVEILPNDASGDALSAITRAEIDMQVATARRYPRVLSKVKQDMLSFATLDEETAQSCFYTLPRGGKSIQGPSIRLAEIAISCYGNLKAGSRPIQTVTTGDNPHVIVQAVAFDMERNTSISIEKRGRIFAKKDKGGGYKKIDEDDINLAVNRCSAIALRDAVYKVVPMALIRPVFLEAKRVAVGDVKSLAAKREKVIERLKQMGATEDRILAVVEARKIEDITLDKLETLIGLGTALKDGETSLEEAFPVAVKLDDPKQTKEAVTTPEAGAKEEAKEESTKSQQLLLMEAVRKGGFSFIELVEWCVASGNLDGPIETIDDMPPEVATRLLGATTGLLKGLTEARAK